MSAPTEPFSAAYYSTRNYRDYLTRKFDALARDIIPCTLLLTDPILDFGCGYGGLVNALWNLRYQTIRGTDISQWAIEEGHRRFPHLRERLQYYNRDLLRQPHALILMLDVLEHMPEYEIESVLKLARTGCTGSLTVRIPVSAMEGEPFVLPVSNNDPTHIACHTKAWWFAALSAAGFTPSSQLATSTIYDSPGVLAASFT